MRLTSAIFTASGSWTCPAGVTSVLVLGQGGGGGGGGGNQFHFSSLGGYGGTGGTSTFLTPRMVDVVPNTTYTITIGAGGAGASSGSTGGSAGETTTFGSLCSFLGARPGIQGLETLPWYLTSTAFGYSVGSVDAPATGITNFPTSLPGAYSAADPALYGNYGAYDYNPAPTGPSGPSYPAHGGGGAGGNSSDAGIGGYGGRGAGAGIRVALPGGDAPSTSYGAGGGGGGAGAASGNTSGAGGGAGAGGRLIIMWPE